MMRTRFDDKASSTSRTLFDLARGHILTLIFAIVLGAIACLFGASLMFTSGYMISLAATIPLTVLALHIPSLFVRIFGVGKPLIDYVQRLISHGWVLRLTTTLRVRYFGILAALCDSAIGKRSYGQVLSELTEDIGHIQDIFLRSIVPVCVAYVAYFTVLALSGSLSLLLALGLLALLAVSLLIVPVIAVRADADLFASKQAMTEDLYNIAVDSMIGAKDLALSSSIDVRVESIVALKKKIFAISFALEKAEKRRSLLIHASFASAVAFLFLWAASSFSASPVNGGFASALASMNSGFVDAISALNVQDGIPYAANWIAAFSICLFPLFEAFSVVGNACSLFSRYNVSLHHLSRAEVQAEDARRLARVDNSSYEVRDFPDSDDGALLAGSLIVEDVRYAYPSNDRETLRGIAMNIDRKQKIAILGKSGSGKSTVLEILRDNLLPTAGHVRVAGKIGYIEQNPYIFNMSIRENLLLANGFASDERIMQALRAVKLDHLAAQREGGLDFILSEGGMDLSGGERQRLALARILLSDCDIVMLDEPFVSLDPKIESDILDILFTVFEDKTIILVTHHLLDIDRFDDIYFIEEGAIDMHGSSDTLMRSHERFERLAQLL